MSLVDKCDTLLLPVKIAAAIDGVLKGKIDLE